MFYLLNKPKGVTSFKAIKDFAKENKIAKIGHTGTLDPLASGLLLVATDDDTKLIEYVDRGFKTYCATMILGQVSDTYDIEGKIVDVNAKLPTAEQTFATLKSFEGVIMQVPPAFSAKKINGVRAYELARRGPDSVVLPRPVQVEIKSIFDFGQISAREYRFSLVVSRGTYIRSLIHDVGQSLGCGALMSDLARTQIGTYSSAQKSIKIHAIDLLTLPCLEISDMKALFQGKKVSVEQEDNQYALTYKSDIFGIVEVRNKIVIPIKLLGNKFAKAGL